MGTQIYMRPMMKGKVIQPPVLLGNCASPSPDDNGGASMPKQTKQLLLLI